MAATSLTILLAGIVDYAGLFPPAGLSMKEAVCNYAQYILAHEAWALGRFILPVARLGEFEKELAPSRSTAWQLSVLGGSNLQNDLTSISDFNSRNVNRALIDTVEIKASSIEEIRAATSCFPKSIQLFIEIPIAPDPTLLIREIGYAGARAKVRTGGVTADAFPSCGDLARFISACVMADVQFKATAGLHHPIRSTYSLTYEADSEKGKMYGFLNVFLAAGYLKNGMNLAEAEELLEEESVDAFHFDNDGVTWHSQRLEISTLEYVRRRSALSFGSCSFREPLDDLREMQLL